MPRRSTSLPNTKTTFASHANRRLRIGELAARSGRTVHALRYYESRGLLPFVTRDAQGRRSYHEQHIQWLMFLDRLQRTGMSLSEMQEYAGLVILGRQSIPQRQSLLQTHLDVVEREMEDIKQSQRLLRDKIEFYKIWHSTGQRPSDIWMESLATESTRRSQRERSSKHLRAR